MINTQPVSALLKKFEIETHFFGLFAFASKHENLENIARFSTMISSKNMINMCTF
jgi:hypothetical protein